MPHPEAHIASARGLLARHGATLTVWARRRCSDPQTAEEVVQDTVLSAWRHYDQYNPARGSERAWILGIARNVAASRHRIERHRRHEPTAETPDVGEPDADMERLLEWLVVVDALRQLSPLHRAAIVEVYYRGSGTRAAAAALGIPEGTVKSRLFHGLRALRKVLEKQGGTV